MNSKIVHGLIAIAKRIGKWILERLAKKGLSKLIGYMDGRIDDFLRRIDRIEKFTKKLTKAAKRRIAWLQFRVRNWTSAVKWLEANAKPAVPKAVAKLLLENEELVGCLVDSEPSERAFAA